MTTKLAALKPEQQLAMGFLKTFTLEPKKSEIFRFTRAGDRIFGRYISRRTTKTRLSESARVLDANIIESIVTDKAGSDEAGPVGVHSIFESAGMTEALDAAHLEPGEHFILQLLWIGASGFKKFECIKVPVDFHGQMSSIAR